MAHSGVATEHAEPLDEHFGPICAALDSNKAGRNGNGEQCRRGAANPR